MTFSYQCRIFFLQNSGRLGLAQHPPVPLAQGLPPVPLVQHLVVQQPDLVLKGRRRRRVVSYDYKKEMEHVKNLNFFGTFLVQFQKFRKAEFVGH